jgi:GntR family transcriptional regulator
MTASMSEFDRIDRRSPMPLYFQLARLLTGEINTGRWRAGDRLPSEAEICETYGVSRATVRQALLRLENEGLIQRLKGRGTFISDSRHRSWLVQSSEGFFHDEVGRFGLDVTSRILRAELAPLPRWASQALSLADDSEGVVLERVRFINGQVALHVTDYLLSRYALAALSLRDRDGSLYDRLREEAGVWVHGGRRIIEATCATAGVAGLLEVGPRTPLLLIESVSWNARLEPFHCYQSWLRTDRLTIEIEVARSAAGAPRSAADAPRAPRSARGAPPGPRSANAHGARRGAAP